MVYDLASVLYQWESVGIFDIILPFLLIFAVVFGLLTSSNFITKHRGVNTLIAFVIALMSLRFGFVDFLAQLFPRLGVGIAVLLALIILTTAFIPKEHLSGWLIGFYVLGAIIAIIVVYQSFSQLSWFGNYHFWNDYTGTILAVLVAIGIIIAISVSGNSESKTSSAGITLPLQPFRS